MKSAATTAGTRNWLKLETSDAHARVDEAYSRFTLHRPEGLAAFLRAHAGALAVCAQKMPSDWAAILRRRAEAARFDLSALRAEPPHELRSAPPGDTQGDPLGVAYVVAGSLHGTTVLRARFLRDRDPACFPDGFQPMFLQGAAWKPLWAEVLDGLAHRAPSAALRDSALATFALFEAAALAETSALDEIRIQETAS